MSHTGFFLKKIYNQGKKIRLVSQLKRNSYATYSVYHSKNKSLHLVDYGVISDMKIIQQTLG